MGILLQNVVVGPLKENTYIVGDKESGECIVIDPGAEGKRILSEIHRLGLTLRLIVNTHGHVDHTGAVAVIKDESSVDYAINDGDVLFLERSLESSIVDMIVDFRMPPMPDRCLHNGDTLSVGTSKFTVLETPGHTPGSICIYGHGMVFTGDTLFAGTIGRYDLPGGNGNQLIKSIFDKLVTLPEETKVFPGHGKSSTIFKEKKENPYLNGSLRIKI